MAGSTAFAAPKYPKNPTWQQAVARVSAYDLATAERVSACESPGAERGTGRGKSPWARNWSNGPRYVGAFGMYHRTWDWAAQGTGYPRPPAATPAMQLLVAVKGAHLFGWSGWGCF